MANADSDSARWLCETRVAGETDRRAARAKAAAIVRPGPFDLPTIGDANDVDDEAKTRELRPRAVVASPMSSMPHPKSNLAPLMPIEQAVAAPTVLEPARPSRFVVRPLWVFTALVLAAVTYRVLPRAAARVGVVNSALSSAQP
jgi:hypothetical protein